MLLVNFYEKRAKGACIRAYEYVADMPGYSETYIEKGVKEKILKNVSKIPPSLEEASLIAKHLSNFKSLKNHPRALYGSRLFSENYKKKVSLLLNIKIR